MSFREGAEKKEGSEDIEKLVDPSADEDNETKVRLDDADDDDGQDDGDDEEERTPSGKNTKSEDGQPRKKDGTWAAKKAQRGQERKAASQWQQEKQEYDRRIARIQEESDRRFQTMQQELDRVRQTGAQGQPRDPMEAKIVDMDRQLAQELALIEQDDRRGYENYQRLQNQKTALIAQHAIIQHTLQQQQQQSQQPADPYAGRRPIIAAEFPWTEDKRYSDLGRKAFAFKQYLVEVEGRPDTLETDREALMTIQSRLGAEYGLRPPPAAPAPRTRSLYTAPASRGAPDRRSAPREVDLGEIGRGHGLKASVLARLVDETLRDGEG